MCLLLQGYGDHRHAFTRTSSNTIPTVLQHHYSLKSLRCTDPGREHTTSSCQNNSSLNCHVLPSRVNSGNCTPTPVPAYPLGKRQSHNPAKITSSPVGTINRYYASTWRRFDTRLVLISCIGGWYAIHARYCQRDPATLQRGAIRKTADAVVARKEAILARL